MRGLLRSEHGSAVVVMLLVFIPLLLAGVFLTTEHARSVYGADVKLGRAVAEAVRAAAMCVDAESDAHGEPAVSPDMAHSIFRTILARNLGLSSATMQPLDGSLVESLEYVLVVYNGDSKWLPGCWKYVFGSGTVSYSLAYAGFPQKFAVDPDDVSFGEGTKTVELASPGCIALVKVRLKPVLYRGSPEEVPAVRWAAARIVRY